MTGNQQQTPRDHEREGGGVNEQERDKELQMFDGSKNSWRVQEKVDPSCCSMCINEILITNI